MHQNLISQNQFNTLVVKLMTLLTINFVFYSFQENQLDSGTLVQHLVQLITEITLQIILTKFNFCFNILLFSWIFYIFK